MEFDNERALLLIELYRRHRSLWDPKDPLYYSKARKAQAWGEVAARVGGAVHEVRRKMESLLGSFRRERSRAARAAARGE
ncbi:hypothetical protein R5R35_001374 [Gryllus longicercus]|uniref:MADF domain-containing protein n=1 Tax=Gryllus longicercus TaxID=2509291 RepID=A0AAN9VG92_9ORTH